MSPLYTYNGQLLKVNGFLAAGQDCCCTETPTETLTESIGCPVSYGSFGWFTSGGRTDLEALLTNAGYTNIQLIPRAPFAGANIPYTDGCGQTYYEVRAECCGTTLGCDPVFISGNIRGIQGPGNQFPPCGAETVNEGFVENCCEE